MARLHVVGALALFAAQALHAQDQPPPRFQSGVEVVTVDITVVDGNGRDVRGRGQVFDCEPIPALLLEMVEAGGLWPQLKRRFHKPPGR